MILGSIMLLSSFAHHATSALTNLQTPASNRIVSHCFTPAVDPDIPETNLKDCHDALVLLARTPDFTTPKSYSKNPRRGMLPLPRAWTSGDCRIMVSCENDMDAYTFRFADVLVVAKELVDTCVGTETTQRWGLLRWGGIHMLGDSVTFYVSVFKQKPLASSTGSVVPVQLVNQTLMNPAIEVSRRHV